MQTTTLRPGFLVSLKTSLSGNVTYNARTIEPEHVTESGEMLAKWETEKTIADPAEHEAGIKARSLARTAITRVCSASTFGLLCPESRALELQDAIREARAVAEAFNRAATITNLSVGVIVGRVASDDAEAVRAINAEVRSLLEDMDSGLRKLDVEAVREAANKARALGQMLTADAAARVQGAIDAARMVARRMTKAGEQAAQELDSAVLDTLARARTAFLDLDEVPAVDADLVAESGRALDLGPVELDEITMTAPGPVARQVEL